jgi:hypothetical protein
MTDSPASAPPPETAAELPTRRILDARNRAGQTVVEAIADDLASHGPPVVAALREHDPAAYARLASDLVAFKELLRAHASPDKPAPPAGEPSPRECLAVELLDAVAADFAQHGREALAALRERNPVAYTRFVGTCVQFRLLTAERAPRKNPGEPRRKPRPLRMKSLLQAMDDGPLDVNSPRLPARWRERWTAEEMALKEQGLTAFDLTPEQLRARWPKRLAAWFEKQLRNGTK